MRNALSRTSFLAYLSAISIFVGCLFDSKQAQRGSVVENEVLAGTMYTEAGEPAANAEVKIFPVDYLPNKGLLKTGADTSVVYTFKTDATGRYVAEGLPHGEYNILGELNGSYSYLDSLTLNSDSKTIPPDTLGAPGSISGYVALEPNHDPRTAFVQVLGTNYFVNADSTGRFVLRNMARGAYAMRVITTLPNYTPFFGNFSVKSGSSLEISDTIRLAFTGIPVVRGLRASYDTAKALTRLSWEPSHYPFLKEYLVYRNDKSALTPPQTPIARVRDTVFVDSLSAFAQGPWPASESGLSQFEYRVRVRNLSDEEGLAFGSVTVGAVPVASVRTKLDIRALDATDGRVSIGDSVRFAVAWSNPSRKSDSLYWIRKSDGMILRAIHITEREGADTIRTTVGSSAGPFQLTLTAKDAAGSLWSQSFGLDVVQDPPQAQAGPDTTVTINDAVHLHGHGLDTFGRIVKWEWDFGATGKFTETSTGDTTIFVGNSAGAVRNVLRVTDDDGNTAIDTMKVDVILDAPSANAGPDTTVTINDAVHLHGRGLDTFGRIVKWEWDFGATGKFMETSTGDTTIFVGNSAAAVRNVLRVTDDDGNTAVDTMKVDVILDVPIPQALGDTFVSISDTIHLSGKATDRTPATLKWEWDIGNTGHFVPTKGPDTLIIAPAIAGQLTCVLRVTDEDGNSATSSLKIRVINDRPIVSLRWRNRLIEDGAGYSLQASATDRGRIVKWEWDFGKLGVYHQSSGPDTAFVPDASTGAKWSVSLRVWDEDNNFSQLDTTFSISKWFLTAFPLSPDGINPYDDVVSAEMNGKIYFVGGTNRKGIIFNNAFSYDPISHQLDTLPPMLEARIHNGFVALNGKFYAIGGSDGKAAKSSMEEYDPVTRIWSTKANLPFAREYCAAAAVNGKLYVFDVLNVYEYDPLADRWTLFAHSSAQYDNNQINPFYNQSILSTSPYSVVEGKIYVVSSASSYRGILRYDPSSDAWTLLSASRRALNYRDMVSLGGKIYGISGPVNGFDLEVYDPSTDSWADKGYMVDRAFWNASTVIGGKIYSITSLGYIEVYDPALEP